MKDKPFLTIKQQIRKLKSQGLSFVDENKAEKVLLNHSYYTIVNAYSDHLVSRKSPRVFKTGATFEELLAIHDFDTGFRRFLFPQILSIEDKIKANVIYGYCNEKNSFGKRFHKRDDYLDLSNYETFTPKKLAAAQELVEQLKKAIESNEKRNPSFKHSKDNYGYIPLWVLMTNLSFGQVSRFYECLNPAVRKITAEAYSLNENELRTMLKILASVRNSCAHSARIFCGDIPYFLPKTIGIGKKKMYVDPRAQRRFGAVLYCLKFLLSEKKFKKIINELSLEICLLNSRLHSMGIKTILKDMGISKQMISGFGIKTTYEDFRENKTEDESSVSGTDIDIHNDQP